MTPHGQCAPRVAAGLARRRPPVSPTAYIMIERMTWRWVIRAAPDDAAALSVPVRT